MQNRVHVRHALNLAAERPTRVSSPRPWGNADSTTTNKAPPPPAATNALMRIRVTGRGALSPAGQPCSAQTDCLIVRSRTGWLSAMLLQMVTPPELGEWICLISGRSSRSATAWSPAPPSAPPAAPPGPPPHPLPRGRGWGRGRPGWANRGCCAARGGCPPAKLSARQHCSAASAAHPAAAVSSVLQQDRVAQSDGIANGYSTRARRVDFERTGSGRQRPAGQRPTALGPWALRRLAGRRRLLVAATAPLSDTDIGQWDYRD